MNDENLHREGVFDPKHASSLDEPWRINELKPYELLENMIGIKAGYTCIDFGSGTGTFALPMAELAGKEGKVYAVDNSEVMMEHIKANNPPPQIVPVLSDVQQTGLDDGIADICFLAFILHEVKQPEKLIGEAARLMKPDGKIVVLEWSMDADTPMPPKHRRISREKIEELFGQTDLTLTSFIERTANHYVAMGLKRAS